MATFGEDACPKVHKYLEVHFNCTAPGSVRGKGQQSSPGGHLAQPQVLSGKCAVPILTNACLFLSPFPICLITSSSSRASN